MAEEKEIDGLISIEKIHIEDIANNAGIKIKGTIGDKLPYIADFPDVVTSISIPVIANTSLTYNGLSQGPTVTIKDLNDESAVIISNDKNTNAGNYILTVSLSDTSKYMWSDNTTSPKTYSYAIGKAEQDISLSSNEIILDVTNEITEADITITGAKGEVAVKSDNESLIAATITDSTIKISYSGSGSGIARVTVNAKETDNYLAAVLYIDVQTDPYILVTPPTVTIESYTCELSGSSWKVFGPTISGFDERTMEISGTISASKAGVYSFTISLKDIDRMEWDDGTTKDLSYSFTIIKKQITTPTLSETKFIYNGTRQGPNITYDTDYVTVDGTLNSINAGSYDINATLKGGGDYSTWADSSILSKTFTYIIQKTSQTITLSSTSVTFNSAHTSETITASGNVGTLSATVSDSTVVTATVKQNKITLQSVSANKNTATVTITAAETTNYYSASVTVSVTADFVYIASFSKAVSDGKLSLIAQELQNGDITKSRLGWSVGDEATISVSGTAYKWVILSATGAGYKFQDGSSVHYVIGMKNCLTTKRQISGGPGISGSSVDSDTNEITSWFMNIQWSSSSLYSYLNNGFRSSLSSDIQNAFGKKFAVKTASSSYPNPSINTTYDYFTIAAEKEIWPDSSLSDAHVNIWATASTERNVLTSFEYYDSNSKREKKVGDSGAVTDYFGRSPATNYSQGSGSWNDIGYTTSNVFISGMDTLSNSNGVSPFGCI